MLAQANKIQNSNKSHTNQDAQTCSICSAACACTWCLFFLWAWVKGKTNKQKSSHTHKQRQKNTQSFKKKVSVKNTHTQKRVMTASLWGGGKGKINKQHKDTHTNKVHLFAPTLKINKFANQSKSFRPVIGWNPWLSHSFLNKKMCTIAAQNAHDYLHMLPPNNNNLMVVLSMSACSL